MTADALPDSHMAWTWQRGNDPGALVLAELPVTPPGPGEVLVRNAVIGLNPVDWKVLGSASWQPGKVPGCDGAGTVIAVGAEVPATWLGQRVAYHTWLGGPGSFAQITPVAARALLPLPDALTFEQAAALPCPALTAWLALSKLPACPENLLVAGAGGAVGFYLTQLALKAGWEVTAQCHPRHHERLAGVGAQVLPWGRQVPEASQSAAVDLRGPEEAKDLASRLRANGHLICVQGRVPGWPSGPFGRCISLHEVALGALHVHGDDRDWQKLRTASQEIFEALLSSDLVAEASRSVDFDCLAHSLQALKYRDFSGKSLATDPSLPDPDRLL